MQFSDGKGSNEEMCLVTIVVATYNCVSTVRRALDSIAAQDYPHIETIVIDGTSTDGTLSVLQEYACRGVITKLVSEPDQGIYDALDKGVQLATGRYLGVLGSDDVLMKGAVSAVVDGFNASNADVVYGGVWYVDAKGHKRYDDQSDRNLDEYLYAHQLSHQSLFVRTNLQKRHPFDRSYHVAADYRFLSMLYYDGFRFYRVNHPIAECSVEGFSKIHRFYDNHENQKIHQELLRTYPFTEEQKRKVLVVERRRRIETLFHFLEMRLTDGAAIIKSFIQRKREIIIFGTGRVSERVARLVESAAGSPVIATAWDNDSQLLGATWHGLPIEAPYAGVTDALILIASSKYEDEMAAQLDGLGYVRGKDFLTWSDAVEKLAALYARRRWHFGGDVPCALEAP